jgi:nucleoid-associated protein YgaU
MGIFDKLLGRKETPPERPDFSGVRTGGGSTLRDEPAGKEAGGPTVTAARTYEVRPGDSLSRIAQRFYGNANQWPRIHEANRDQIKDPDLIYPGQKLIIP